MEGRAEGTGRGEERKKLRGKEKRRKLRDERRGRCKVEWAGREGTGRRLREVRAREGNAWMSDQSG